MKVWGNLPSEAPEGPWEVRGIAVWVCSVGKRRRVSTEPDAKKKRWQCTGKNEEMKHREENLVGRRERKQDGKEYMVQQRGMVLSCVHTLADWRGEEERGRA